ncbi:hypothetical protein ACROYT_G019860 [Oculina patagonica]
MVKHCIAFGCQNRSSKAECKDLSWHSLPLSNKNLLAQWLVKLRRENTPVSKNSYVCSQHFEANCFIKPVGGQRTRLKPDSVPTKFIFTVEKPKRKEPADRATLVTKKTKIEKSQQHSAPEPINIENTDLNSGSDGIEAEHLESEGLFQTGDENWEHQLQLKDAEIFKELDVFPSKEIVKIHLPECFRKKYSTTTLIIDATEIYIEKPNNPEAQQVTFSSYKNNNTLKALVGIVPKGRISFVSTLYGGSISDKELTQKSGLIEKLQYGDVIMTDRGYDIEICKLCECDGINIKRASSYNSLAFGKYCGRYSDKYLESQRRSGIPVYETTLYVRFVSDDTVHRKGFNFSFVAFSGSGGRESYLNASKDETIEFGTPKVGIQNYPAAFAQQWFLIVPEGRQIQIDFDIFELEKSEKCRNDYVEFREVNDPRYFRGYRGPILTGHLCGSSKPSTIQSSGNMVWVHFKSDYNATTVYKGFKASFKAGQKRLSVSNPLTLLFLSVLLMVASKKSVF